jgi:DNA-binding transcriptional ArsR family regulator
MGEVPLPARRGRPPKAKGESPEATSATATTDSPPAAIPKGRLAGKVARAANRPAATLTAARRVASTLKQASEPTRLLILLGLLRDGRKHVGALSDSLSQTQPAVSYHLALLRHSGLIEPERRGKNNFYLLTESGERLAGLVAELMEG